MRPFSIWWWSGQWDGDEDKITVMGQKLWDFIDSLETLLVYNADATITDEIQIIDLAEYSHVLYYWITTHLHT